MTLSCARQCQWRKNTRSISLSKIAGSKSVVDGKGANRNYVVGGEVTWTIKAEIPRVANDAAGATTRYKATDAFEIRDTLVDEQLTTTVDGITVTAPAGLEKGDDKDYTVTPVTEDDETTWTIAFTETGLGKLAAAVNADVRASSSTTAPLEMLISTAVFFI